MSSWHRSAQGAQVSSACIAGSNPSCIWIAAAVITINITALALPYVLPLCGLGGALLGCFCGEVGHADAGSQPVPRLPPGVHLQGVANRSWHPLYCGPLELCGAGAGSQPVPGLTDGFHLQPEASKVAIVETPEFFPASMLGPSF